MVNRLNKLILEAQLQDRWEFNSGHVGSDSSPAASNVSYMPPAMFATKRIHFDSASLAAARAESFHVLDRPSAPGSLHGQRKLSP